MDDFSLKGGGTLLNSYRHMRCFIVKENHIGSVVRDILRLRRHTDRKLTTD